MKWENCSLIEQGARVPLPHYPFQRSRYLLSSPSANSLQKPKLSVKEPDISKWFYSPSVRRSVPVELLRLTPPSIWTTPWLVFHNDDSLGEAVQSVLRDSNRQVVSVKHSPSFVRVDEWNFGLNPRDPVDYSRCIEILKKEGKAPSRVVHLWNLIHPSASASSEPCTDPFYSPLFFQQALANRNLITGLNISVVTSGILQLGDAPRTLPLGAQSLGPCRVFSNEYPGVRCSVIDVSESEAGSDPATIAERVVAETDFGCSDPFIAYWRGQRWVNDYESIYLPPLGESCGRLRVGGVYLITGGLGALGVELAKYLNWKVGAKLILMSRSSLSKRSSWSGLNRSQISSEIASKINAIEDLESSGATLLCCEGSVANVSDVRRVRREVSRDSVESTVFFIWLARLGAVSFPSSLEK